MAIREEFTVTRKDGALAGPLRQPVNTSRDAKGSIHDDATATRLGFRGGTVAGSIHMELFPPLLRAAWGRRWFERGTLSLYFLNATTDREAVRAFIQEPPAGAADAQVEAWVLRDDGMQVAQGTASVGDPGVPTALQARPLERFEPGELRILAGVQKGHRFAPVDVRCDPAEQERRLAVTTEPMDWYRGEGSPWGAPPVLTAPLVQMLYAKSLAQVRGGFGAVGLFGAIEVRNVNGPALVGETYTCTGEVIAVGQSPKTEYLWFETELDDAGGRRVAEMRMLLRFMKASSGLYPELQQG